MRRSQGVVSALAIHLPEAFGIFVVSTQKVVEDACELGSVGDQLLSNSILEQILRNRSSDCKPMLTLLVSGDAAAAHD